MKNLFALIICLSFSTFLIAQVEEEEKTYRHSVGVNIKSIIGISDFGFFASPSSPYSFQYRFDTNKVGFRLGYGGSYSSTDSESDSNGSTSDYTRRLTDIRLGLDFAIFKYGKFEARAGGDFVTNLNYSKNEWKPSGQGQATFNESDYKSYGFGPVLVVQYHLNDRIMLSTESAMYFSRFEQENLTRSSNTNFEDQLTSQSGVVSNLFEAANLYLNIRF